MCLVFGLNFIIKRCTDDSSSSKHASQTDKRTDVKEEIQIKLEEDLLIIKNLTTKGTLTDAEYNKSRAVIIKDFTDSLLSANALTV